jgi:hypothetical protein
VTELEEAELIEGLGRASSAHRNFAEDECRKRNRPKMDLSASELQPDALSLHRNSRYQPVREEVTVVASNKTLVAESIIPF